MAALAVKAYAYWRGGKRLINHGDLWGYIDVMVNELGDCVRDTWNAANSTHTCFYEGWCTIPHVNAAIIRIEKLINEVHSRVSGNLRAG